MLKKTITYEDFNGDMVTEDHFFHISKADLVELEVSHEGGMATWLQKIVESNNGKDIIEEFKKLLLMSYGKKSADGKRFIRTPEMREEFLSSEAYSTLFMELVTDATAAAAFVNGIVPKNLEADLANIQQPAPVAGTPPRILTRTEIREMDFDELKHLLATGQAVMGE